jgi:hypothetical protein
LLNLLGDASSFSEGLLRLRAHSTFYLPGSGYVGGAAVEDFTPVIRRKSCVAASQHAIVCIMLCNLHVRL